MKLLLLTVWIILRGFNKFSVHVKSQVKCMIKLYKEFIDDKNNVNN